ncbi:MAG: HAD family acid phosphatase [Myxococcota bacterium]
MRVTARPIQTGISSPITGVGQPQEVQVPSEKVPAGQSAPIPSASDFARKGMPSAHGSRAFDLRMQALKDPTAPVASPADGIAFCHAALKDIRERTARGEKVRVVFDLDNTLFDTRVRTVAVAHAYDKARGTSHFANLRVEDVGRDGKHTAERMGLPANVVEDFRAFWDKGFWDGANMVHDTPMPHMAALAHAAKSAGAEIVYLTGRVTALHEASLAQLVRAGLPDGDADNLYCKPGLGMRTAPFKEQMMEAWQQQGIHIAFFVTEGRRDIAHLQKEAPTVPCVLLDDPLERGGTELHADTPVLPHASPVVR